ncbi:MAG: hypothetical protein A2150_03225 [Candidatus Muproteobacteria bacterium RBG_16_64_11]|uniref:Alginate export domain-containing protein n=1 Tax=Candidatus Muproteobacteria bacterium RBG_16_64_11 TaxID=1817758 RepID=A0A1F6TIC3_9PROT|nr:MAG: hypothetical protein A2150_03225 [Candidatus Muproteobacteria bacterium RBG_16_64_11]
MGEGEFETKRIRTRCYIDRLFLCALCVFASNNLINSPIAFADDWQFGGHAKYQYTVTGYARDDVQALYGDDPARDNAADLRLKAEKRAGPWDFSAHYELLAIHGNSLETRRRLATAGLLTGGTVSGLPDDRRRLFDLTDDLTDRNRTVAVQRLDRLALGYRTDRQVVRVGRQAVSWGNGLVFQPLDFVNPFSPLAIDKDYKTGDDMLYGQWLLAGQNDLQAIILPRRDPVTGGIESRQSSYAAKSRTRLGVLDLDLLAARHYDETLVGAGLVKSLGGAVGRLDVSYADLADGDGAWSLVTNLDYSWTWGGKNIYGYLEYFRNGVGESASARYATPNAALAARLARGELFALARDYAALGLQVELAPLVNLYQGLILNLNDGSGFYQVRGVYDWRQNVQLMAGFNLPFGARGDEYGGIPVGIPGIYAASGRSVYVRAAHYF